MQNLLSTNNALDGAANPLGFTLDVTKRTTPYKCYTGTLTSGNSPVVLDVYTDLGDYGTCGFIYNSSSSDVTFTISFSIDGTNYGDEIPVKVQQTVDLTKLFSFKKLRLTRVSADSTYTVMII